MRLAELVRTIVQAIVEPRLLLSALYPATVAGQESSGVLDVVADAPEVRGTGAQGVPYWCGLPGFVASVPDGIRAMVAFGAADPSQASVVAYGAGCAVTKVAFDGGTASVARTNDTVNTGQFIWDAATTTMYWRLLPGIPWAAVPSSAASPPGIAEPGLPTTGLISSGNSKLLA